MAHSRDRYARRLASLKLERGSFDTHYKELQQYNSPRRGRFWSQDRNKGARKHQSIINSKGLKALKVATAGLFAGVMSPTRPWHALATPDPDLMKFQPVKVWLEQVEKQQRAIFNAGNLYTMAPTMIAELLQFGTGCMTHLDDEENLATFFAHTVGSYYLSQDEKFRINTLVREYDMTAEQMAKEFTDGKDLSNLSPPVRLALDRNNFDQWFTVIHFIEPNDDFRPNNFLKEFKPFASVKYEKGSNEKEKFLSRSGFDEFPAYCPRWEVAGEDVYGTDCPGMGTLGDIKQLQIQEKRKGQAIDKMVNPPLSGPPSIRNTPVSSLPGGLTIYDGGNQQELKSIYKIDLRLGELKDDMDRVERRIEDAFFVDLFLAISNMAGIQPRNELELSERNAERLLQLGPVLERMQFEFLDQLIERTFNQQLRAELLPPPPPELEGSTLKVEYISSLAQAQRAVDTRSIDAITTYQAGLLQAGLSDGKKFNGDEAIQAYSDLLGTPAKILHDQQQVDQQRVAEAQAAQQQAQLEMATKAAGAARDAGQAAQAAGNVDLDANSPVTAGIENLNSNLGN
jgi:hypothetical protein